MNAKRTPQSSRPAGRKSLKTWLALATGLVASVALAPAASGGALAACDGQTIEHPFLAWHDAGSYALVPNGALEEGATGWTLAGASVRPGNEPFFVHGASDGSSLFLAQGSSATTPPACVGLLYPYMRFFADGSDDGLLKVETISRASDGTTRATTIGYAWRDLWSPTRRMAFLPSSTVVRSEGGTSAVAFRFTALVGSWQVDDVYVDPFLSR